jgi:hypothetical protein
LIDGDDNRPGGRIRLLANVDGVGGESHRRLPAYGR